jgi:hypothetical protein
MYHFKWWFEIAGRRSYVCRINPLGHGFSILLKRTILILRDKGTFDVSGLLGLKAKTHEDQSPAASWCALNDDTELEKSAIHHP